MPHESLGWLINRQRSKGLHLSGTLLCSFFWFSHGYKLITLCILQATHLVSLRASPHRRCRRGCLGWLINRQRSKGLHLSRTLLCFFFWFSHVHKLITLCILQATHLVYLRASTHRRCRRGLWVGWLILRCKWWTRELNFHQRQYFVSSKFCFLLLLFAFFWNEDQYYYYYYYYFLLVLSLKKIPKMLTNSRFVCLFVFQSLKGHVFIDQWTFTTFSV